jgi:hypothetical protein
MKHYLSIFAILIGTLSVQAQTNTNAPATAGTATTTASANNGGFCNIHDLSDSCKKVIRPFVYSSQSAVRVALKSEPQIKDIVFPAFQGAKYRVIINTLSMPSGTEVDVYDRDPSHSRSQQLFSTKTQGISNFDVESRSGRIFVEYTIPPATATNFTGCSVVVFGFENSNGKAQ